MVEAARPLPEAAEPPTRACVAGTSSPHGAAFWDIVAADAPFTTGRMSSERDQVSRVHCSQNSRLYPSHSFFLFLQRLPRYDTFLLPKAYACACSA